jgi:pimeloyl-ACP methyl ester carboxylesterase
VEGLSEGWNPIRAYWQDPSQTNRADLRAFLTPETTYWQHKPPFLAVWGKTDPFFLPAGAEAFKRDIPGAEVRFFDTGHFALETHCDEIAAAIRDFLPA